jgi:hypothetical protein
LFDPGWITTKSNQLRLSQLPDYDGSMGFDIGFTSADEAQLFRTAFG